MKKTRFTETQIVSVLKLLVPVEASKSNPACGGTAFFILSRIFSTFQSQ